MKKLRYRMGVRLLHPWLVLHMQEQNHLASVYVTHEKRMDAMSQRDALASFLNGSARRERRYFPQATEATP